MMEERSFRMAGGLNLTRALLSRHSRPGELIGVLNYEASLEGYKRIDGYERFDGRPAPSETADPIERDNRRNGIGEVPGVGDILGVWRYRATTFALRRHRTGQVRFYRSSPTSWQQLSLGSIMSFERGSGVPLQEGIDLTGQRSSALARTRAVIVEGGDWEFGTARGYAILEPRSVSRFLNGELVYSGREDATEDGLVFSGAIFPREVPGVAIGYFPGIGLLRESSTSPSDYPTLGNFRSLSLSNNNSLTIELYGTGDLFSKELVLEDTAFRFDEAAESFGESSGTSYRGYRWQVDNVSRARIWGRESIRVRVRDRGYRAEGSRGVTNSEPIEQEITAAEISRFRFITHNFTGQSGAEKMYGVTGEGPAFEFDGETFVELRTGVVDDRPIFVAEHSEHLFLGYRNGSVIHSGVGKPRNFEAIEGAAELAIGDRITGMVGGYKESLFVFGRNKTSVLKGTSPLDWRLPTLSDEAGCMEGSANLLDQPLVFDDRGLRFMEATQAFGDFSIATATEHLKPWLAFKHRSGAIPVDSVRVRNKSQYRLFFSDGDILVMTAIPRGNFLSREFTFFSYDLYQGDEVRAGVVNHSCSVEDPDGRERIFFSMKGSGFVYEMDKGPSFDGSKLPAYVRFPYNHLGTPNHIKRFRKLHLECDSVERSRFLLSATFDDDREEGEPEEFSVLGRTAYWDEQAWDEFEWDSTPEISAHARLFGRGRNISILIYSEDTDQPPHTFTGITVFFDPRRRIR